MTNKLLLVCHTYSVHELLLLRDAVSHLVDIENLYTVQDVSNPDPLCALYLEVDSLGKVSMTLCDEYYLAYRVNKVRAPVHGTILQETINQWVNYV